MIRREHLPFAEATARLWHGYCVSMSTHPEAGVVECEAAVATLRAGHDRVRLAEALVICATVLGFAHHFERSLDALSEALQGTVSADTKLSVGPISVPLAPFITLLGKLLQAPRHGARFAVGDAPAVDLYHR